MLTLDEIPNKRSSRYPKPRTVKLTREADELIDRLKGLGKEPSDFMRIAIERALLSVFPEERDSLCSAGAVKAS